MVLVEGKTATSSTSYNGLSTTITNALGHQKTTTASYSVVTKYRCSSSKYGKDACLTLPNDIRGNKTKMNDPDMGTWTYSYNALGKLVSVVFLCPRALVIVVLNPL
jgi:YD repeat-containing protein